MKALTGINFKIEYKTRPSNDLLRHFYKTDQTSSTDQKDSLIEITVLPFKLYNNVTLLKLH